MCHIREDHAHYHRPVPDVPAFPIQGFLLAQCVCVCVCERESARERERVQITELKKAILSEGGRVPPSAGAPYGGPRRGGCFL